MKKMKRLVAVFLAGIMALAMLTACGGTPSTPVTRDEALEKSVAAWTVELGKGAGLELTEDAALTAISEKCLTATARWYDARVAGDREAVQQTEEEMSKVVANATNGKKIYTLDIAFPIKKEVTKENFTKYIQQNISSFQREMLNKGVENPAKFGVTVTKQDEYTLILFMVSE